MLKGIFDWLRRRKPSSPPLATSPLAPPPCHPLLIGATHVRLRRPGEAAVLFESTRAEDLLSLGTALDADAEPFGYCMCIGTLDIDVQRSAASPVTISLHHGVSLRWTESKGNVSLRSPDAILDWLSARGMNFVREEYEEGERRGEESLAQKRRWHDALPVSLRPFLDEMQTTGATTKPAWTAAIEQEFPDPIKRAAVLIELFGSGVGPWSGYPSWESVPEELLLAMPLDVLVSAMGTAPGDQLLDGGARLFAGWAFRKRRGKDLQRVPAALRSLLLARVTTIGDEEKVSAVRKAFEAKTKP